jgi:hypothetical protein
MAAPDANVYVEIPAPDIRFAAILVLAAVALLLWRRLGAGRSPTFAMLAVLLLSAAIWLSTTGNGRYFMPLLVAAGPIAIALVCVLPATRALKAALAALLVAGQAFVLMEQPPWNSWTLLQWKRAPYFDVRLGPEETRGPPTTYASMSMISYSLIAPQFPEASRWINLVASSGTPRDHAMTDAFLRKAAAEGPIKVIAPSLPWASLPDGRPNAEILGVFNALVARRNLRIPGSCRHVASPGLIRMAEEEKRGDPEAELQLGFWICPAVYEPGLAEKIPEKTPPPEVMQVFDRLAQLCPRFFPDGEKSLVRLPDGWTRHYAVSETRVYILDSGRVWYQFWRSLNPVSVGLVPDVISGKARVDCSAIRGSDGAWRTGSQ